MILKGALYRQIRQPTRREDGSSWGLDGATHAQQPPDACERWARLEGDVLRDDHLGCPLELEGLLRTCRIDRRTASGQFTPSQFHDSARPVVELVLGGKPNERRQAKVQPAAAFVAERVQA